jgi:hypothetical protein
MAKSFSQKEKYINATGLLLIIGFFFGTATLASASEGNFSVEPLFTDIRLDGEVEHPFSLEVGNTTSNPIVFRLSFVDFGSLDESGGIAFLGQGSDPQKRYGLAGWLSAERDVVTVFPGEKETIRLMVTNRESLSPGGHYGAVLFHAEKEGNDTEDSRSNVSISSNFTALVFVRKAGGEIWQLQYRDRVIRTDMLSVPDKVSERFQNSGNVHVTPRGIVEVKDPLGRIVRRGILNEESGIILPESYRSYPIVLKYLEKAIFPGFYTLSATYRYDGREDFTALPASRTFAWGLFFLWALGILGCVFIVRRVFRNRKKKGQSV